jgi:tetratricopeptide (TPR) repeat protein
MKKEWKDLALRSAVIVLATLFVYIPTMQADFIWDDNLLLTHFPLMHSDDALGVFWSPSAAMEQHVPDFYPLTWTTLWLEWRLWGNSATGYHVANVVMHALGAVLVWLALKRLAVPGAFLAGLIFAVHPVNVASVAWVIERKNTLSILFYLLTIIAYLKFEDTSRQRWYALSLVMFVAALLSKTSVVTTPAVLLLCVWWRRNRITWKDLARTAPFFLLAVACAYMTVQFQTANVIQGEEIRQAHENGPWRLALAGMAPWFYIYKALLPLHLLMIYPRWDINPYSAVSYLPGVAILACLAFLWFQRRKPWAKAILFALAYFLVTLFPVLGFFDMYYMTHSLVADHWQYVSIIAVIALTVAGAARLVDRTEALGRKAVVAAACVVLAVLSVLTWNLGLVYKDQITLWEYNLAINPNAWMGQYNLGTTYGERALASQDKQEADRFLRLAAERLEIATRLKPTYSAAFNNLGLTQMHSQRIEEAIANYRKAIEIDPSNPNPHAYANLGIALTRQGKDDEAIGYFQRAMAIAPQFVDPVFQMGMVLARQGRTEQAVDYLSRTIAMQPMHYDAYLQRALGYLKLGRVRDAVLDLRRAITIRPDLVAAYYQLGLLAQQANAMDDARRYYLQALLYEPNLLEARYRLGVVLAELGATQEAIATLKMTVNAYPAHADAHAMLGGVLSKAGQIDQAVEHYRKALELKPAWPEVMRALAELLLFSQSQPDPSKAQEALRLAQQAAQLTNRQQPLMMETLAVAYAENGQFTLAVDAQQHALDLLATTADKKLIDDAAGRLEIYKSGRTLRLGPASGEGPLPQGTR